ncbi:MAG: FMN-binding protein [Phycisphaerales bacterium]|jgi:Na+-translocating ferredoxin:NAD+ oxidoreductase RnfG subunit
MATSEGFKAVWERLAFPLGFATLVIAFIIGQIAARPDYEALLQELLAENKLTRVTEAEGGQIVFRDETEGNYVVISEAEGYGGPLIIGIRASAEGKIAEILNLRNKETPAYFEKLKRNQFFRQFAGKTVSADFLLDEDINAVSGATVSSQGFTIAVRSAMHIAATEHFKLKPTWKQPAWDFGVKEIGLIAVFALAFIVAYAKGKPAKWVRRAMPFVVLGFVGIYTNSSLSIGQLSGIVLGYIPGFKENTLWWIMVIGALGSVLILGKNIYCANVCPFQYVERGLNKISGINLAVKRGVQKSARTVVGLMTWTALMLIFLSSHPTLGSYEPFSLIFSLTGTGVHWYILPLSLIGSFFVLNFWCRLFCPVGHVLNKTVRVRRRMLGAAKPIADEVQPAEPEDKGDLWRKES